MQIQGYSSTQAVNPFELNTQSRRRSVQEQPSSTGDTVSISPEAMELLARMQAAKREAAQDEANKLDTTSQSTAEETGKTGKTGTASAESKATEAAGESKGDSKDASSDTNEQAMEQIRKQIQQLAGVIQNIMKSPQPVETKLAQTQPFEVQIQELEERLRELEASSKEQAQQQK